MANPFYVSPPNVLEALMLGQQGYEGAQKRAKQSQIETGQKAAMQALQSGGDTRGALANLLGVGDYHGASVLAALEKNRTDANGVFGTPIYGTDEQGNTKVGTFDKTGQFRPIDTPGFKPTPGIRTVDTGTGTVILDSRTGAPVGQPTQPAAPGQPVPQARQPAGYIPKDVVGKERAEEIGKGQGQATVALPAAESKAATALQTIDQLEKHPGKKFAIGVPGVIPGIPGTQQRDYIALLEQAKGQTFLQAFESLKGGGAITEVEGRKAEQAIARLDRAQSPEGYNQALKDLRGVIERGLKVARERAGQSKPQGGVVDYRTYFQGQ